MFKDWLSAESIHELTFLPNIRPVLELPFLLNIHQPLIIA